MDKLTKICDSWSATLLLEAEDGESTDKFKSRVVLHFQQSNPSIGRSEKAIKDKMDDLKALYKFVCDFNNSRIPGSTGKGPWFELVQSERKAIAQSNNRVRF